VRLFILAKDSQRFGSLSKRRVSRPRDAFRQCWTALWLQ
jgi:hypothetical protein